MAPVLEISDLCVHFDTYEGRVQALDNISFTIEHGETFGLVGESGCGKSVTSQAIMGLVRPPGKISGGSIKFFPDPAHPKRSEELLRQSDARLRNLRGRRIAMIFQEPNAALDPIMSIGRQVGEVFFFHRLDQLTEKVADELARDRRRYGRRFSFLRPLYALAARHQTPLWLKVMDHLPLAKQWRRPMWEEAFKRSAAVLAKLGIPNPDELLLQYPHNLSGGMKQRMVIAMALAADPVLLIADEATSNLDVTIQAQILDLIRELKRTTLSSLLFITHDLGVVAETCDRVGVMYAGTLCETAGIDALFSRPLHPYTQALLNSVPKLETQKELLPISGSVPNLTALPSGCRFHPRCPRADDICRTEKPVLETAEDAHLVACHHWERWK